MHQSEVSIFRNEALEHYIQNRAKNVLPRITTPPVSFCLWGLLVLCIAVIALTCLGQVPVYVNGTGIVLAQNATILVFVPTSSTHPLQLHAGAPVHLQIGTGQTINSIIDQVETGVYSPDAAQKRYGLGEKVSQLLTGPSIVATVKAGLALVSPDYEGSVISVQVQVDTTRVLSLLLESTLSNGEEQHAAD